MDDLIIIVMQTCIVRVDTRSRWTPWERTVERVLNKCHGMFPLIDLFFVQIDTNGNAQLNVIMCRNTQFQNG